MKRNILVLEDDITNSLLIRQMLSKDNIDVDTVSDAITGWEKVKTNHYDLFIIDLNLPFGINGFEFLSRIRSLEEYKTTPAIAITAYIGIFTRKDCQKKGFDYYFAKPFDIRQFSKQVLKILETN